MLDAVEINNFGPLIEVNWQKLGNINLVIGCNGSGKTFLLKALYSAMRTIEEHKRGDDPRTEAQILSEKLYWTFQPDRIGDLVTKGADAPLSCSISFNGHKFNYSFGKETTKQINSVKNPLSPRESNSVFLPAKEVLSLHHIILKSRDQDKMFGFDDTYLDLARALQQPLRVGKNSTSFSKSRKNLESLLGGKVAYDDTSKRWQFQKDKQKFPIGVTAEGIKKIAILDTLLGNRYLDKNSIIFIDEPESALHPKAISQFLDIIAMLSSSGVQFFLASHSYFVVKKLFLIANKENMSIPVISACEEGWQYTNLLDGMLDNPIIDESIRLYEEEVELVLNA